MTYDPASGTCAGRSQPGAKALMAWCLDEYPAASNLGIYVCRSVRGGTSKSVHADGRALDVAFPLIDGGANDDGHDLAARLVLNHEALGIQLVIFDRMLWSSVNRTWRKHCGHAGARSPHAGCSGPHLDHLHIELTWQAAKTKPLTAERIETIFGPTAEDDMPWTDEDRADQKAIRAALESINHQIAGDGTRLARVVRAVEAVRDKVAPKK